MTKKYLLEIKNIPFFDFDAIIPRSPNFSATYKNRRLVKRLMTILKLTIEQARKKNIFVLNNEYFATYTSLDKLAQQFFLFTHNLPGIPTKFFSDVDNIRTKYKIKYPLVIKTAQGSRGSGVFKADNEKELKKIMVNGDKEGKFFLYQDYFKIDCDYRVLVIDKKAINVMRRKSNNPKEWRTNFSLGGNVCKIEGNQSIRIKKLAEKVALEMKFDYVGVDILEYKNKLYVIEVNSLAQFKGFEKAFDNVNIAEEIIKFVEKKVKRIKHLNY